MKECCSTVTIPLEEYETLKIKKEEVKVIRETVYKDKECIPEWYRSMIEVNFNKLKEKNSELSTKVSKIPKWIRKIFEAL